MKFIAEIEIMPHKELLDPQGKTVAKNMKYIHLEGIEDVRIGKHIKILIQANSQEDATEKIKTACEKILSNPIMESYTFSLSEA
jgi:phosphoribosylformylglycinamidine synthase PurS subunit